MQAQPWERTVTHCSLFVDVRLQYGLPVRELVLIPSNSTYCFHAPLYMTGSGRARHNF